MRSQREIITENCGANEIRCCSPGLELFEATTSFTPDMVVLDAGRQSYDCLNMISHLQKINPLVHIALITGPEEQSLRQEAREAGVGDIFAGVPADSDLITSVKKRLDSAPKIIERRPIAGSISAHPRRRAKRHKPYAAALSIFGNVVFGVLLVIMLTLSFFLVQSRYTGGIPKVFGHHLYVVLSGSMNPAFDTGSLVFVRPSEPESIQKGDIITFGSSGGGAPTTHRVVDIKSDEGLAFVTRGDANNIDDPNPVPPEHVVGKVRGFVPYLGFLMGFARTKTGMICLVFIPGILVIARELHNIYRVSAEREKRN